MISEGLTDNTGIFVFETSKKDEFLTVVASKQGFFVGQRTFVKDLSNHKSSPQNTDKNDPNSIEKISNENPADVQKDLIIVLVRESLIADDKSILFITYSNSFTDNFEPLFLYSDKGIYYLTITVSEMLEIQCSDTQKDIGILTAQFKRNLKKIKSK